MSRVVVNNWLCQYFPCATTTNLFNNLNRQKLKNIAIIFTQTIKMLFSPTYIFVGFDIGFIYPKTVLEIDSRTKILFKTVLTGYQINNITSTGQAPLV